ncbi:mast cell protease 1A-like, partial [Podarcis lilfordi]
LNSKATLNEYVQILPLPKFNSDLSEGTPCSVAGWDWVYKGWSPNVTIFGRSRCKRLYHYYYNYGNVCSRRQNKNVFKGITGGPLVCNGVAEGIILYRYPGIYTRISHYLPWIKRTMNL